MVLGEGWPEKWPSRRCRTETARSQGAAQANGHDLAGRVSQLGACWKSKGAVSDARADIRPCGSQNGQPGDQSATRATVSASSSRHSFSGAASNRTPAPPAARATTPQTSADPMAFLSEASSPSTGSSAPGRIAVSPYIIKAMDRWSGSFSKLLLPSGLGSKAVIKQCTDEGAKVLSTGIYMAYRIAEVGEMPYDGSTYEGHTMKDDSEGTLWAYETAFPDGFQPVEGERFVVSLGHVYKCTHCRGQGRVKCQTCGGKVRWRSGDTEYTCNCGDGHQNCGNCTGFGQLLKVLRVATKYSFEEKKAKEYTGRLPQALLMGSTGKNIYCHVAEFKQQVIAEAIDGFDSDEFERLMAEVHSELKRDVCAKAAGQMVNPQILHELIDGYFRELPNPVTANKRLKEECLPVRLKCEVSDVPVTGVKYEYKGRKYSLYVYGNDGKVWVDGAQPSEFTWKVGVVLGVVAAALIMILILIASAGSGSGGSPDRRGGPPSGRRTSSTFQPSSHTQPSRGLAGTPDVQQPLVRDHNSQLADDSCQQALRGQDRSESLEVAKADEGNLVECGLWKTITPFWA